MLAKYDDDFDRLLQQRADVNRRLQSAADLKDPRAIDRLVDEVRIEKSKQNGRQR